MRRGEAIRTGFLLSQGGEFAFVLLSLAKELKVPPALSLPASLLKERM